MSLDRKHISHHIHGDVVSDPHSAVDEIINPWTGRVAYRVERGTTAVMEKAIGAAFESFNANRARPAHERAQWLRDSALAMEEISTELIDILVETIGKPRKAASAEVTRSASVFRLAAEELVRLGGETLPVDALPGVSDVLSYTTREPYGVAALITPFNAPLNLLAQKLAPAIAMGNAVVIKPSVEGAAVTARLIAAIAPVCPAGLVSVVSGNHEAVHHLVRSSRVAVVSLTGGIVAGKAVLEAAGIKPVHLELGSNSPNIILDDADITVAAAKISRAAFEASGQQCISAQRILVQEAVWDEFLSAMTVATKELVVGDPRESTTDVGPVVHARAATRHRALIDSAEESGAQILVDGRNTDADHPLLLGPTLLAKAGLDAAVMCEEAFGPIAVIEPVASLEEAVEIANSTGGLLQSACFTNDLNRAMKAVRGINAGSVWINEATRTRFDIYPFGGTGESGLGREGIRFAMEGFSQLKHVGIRTTTS